MVTFVGCTLLLYSLNFSTLLFLVLFTVVFISVGEAGFDSPEKLAGRPLMRVPPLLGGSHKFLAFFFFCF